MKKLFELLERRPEWFNHPDVDAEWQQLMALPITNRLLTLIVERGNTAMAARALLVLVVPFVELLPFMQMRRGIEARYMPNKLPAISNKELLRFLVEALEACEAPLPAVREQYAYYRAQLFESAELDEVIGQAMMRAFRPVTEAGDVGPLKALLTGKVGDFWRIQALTRAQVRIVAESPKTTVLQAFCVLLDDLLAEPTCPLADSIVFKQLEFLQDMQREVGWRPTWRYESFEYVLRASARHKRRRVRAVFTGSSVLVPGRGEIIITRYFTNTLCLDLQPEHEQRALEKMRNNAAKA